MYRWWSISEGEGGSASGRNAMRIFIHVALLLTAAVGWGGRAAAAPVIHSAMPAAGPIGADLTTHLRGEGFSADMAVWAALDSGNRSMLLGALDTPGYIRALDGEGTRAYLICGEEPVVMAIGIEDPTAPAVLDFSAISERPVDLAARNGLVYLLDETEGLVVVDPSDPANPSILGRLALAQAPRAIFAGDALALVAGQGNATWIIDIRSPEAPQVIGEIYWDRLVADLAFSGNRACLAGAEGGVRMFDIAEPADPRPLGEVDLKVKRIRMTGHHVFAIGYGSFSVIAIPPSGEPALKRQAPTSPYAADLDLMGEMAAVADGYGGIQLFDISEPENPQPSGHAKFSGFVSRTRSVGGVLCAMDSLGGFYTLDALSPPEAGGVVSMHTPGTSQGLSVWNGIVGLADGYDGVRFFDIENPAAPLPIGDVPAKNATRVFMTEGRCYVAQSGFGVLIIGVEKGAEPRVLGTVDTAESALDVAAVGNLLYVAELSGGGFEVFDVADPAAPERLGGLSVNLIGIGGMGVRLAARGDYVYMTGGRGVGLDYLMGLQVIDVSDPRNPRLAKMVDFGNYGDPMGLALAGNRAYVTDENGLGGCGMRIIDISDPRHPQMLDSIVFPGSVWDIAAYDDGRVYLGNTGYESGIHLIDASGPAPRLITTLTTLGKPMGVVRSNAALFIADGPAGFTVMPDVGKLTAVDIESATDADFRIHAPVFPGHYNLVAMDPEGESEFRGAVSFLTGPIFTKAILVAGRTHPDNPLWAPTVKCVNYAYKALIHQGFDEAHIRYLSPDSALDPDLDGRQDDVAGPATPTELEYAITQWAADAHDVILYLMDHGGDGFFHLDSQTLLSAAELDGWLDTLQRDLPGRVIVIYEACRSGSFLPLLDPPPGRDRIVIASAGADRDARILMGGGLSFSFQFWSYILSGAPLDRAFKFAARMMDLLASDQGPLIDADGNGVGNEKTEPIPNIVIGRGMQSAAGAPIIGAVSEDRVLAGERWADFHVGSVLADAPIALVRAIIIPPGGAIAATGDPVLDADVPNTILNGPDEEGIYRGAHGGFESVGDYAVLIHAMDEGGAISLPMIVRISQTESPPPRGDLDGDGIVGLKDAILGLKILTGAEDAGSTANTLAGSDSALIDTARNELARIDLARIDLARIDLARIDLAQIDLVQIDPVQIDLARIDLDGDGRIGAAEVISILIEVSKSGG